jgi:ATP synthase protein I
MKGKKEIVRNLALVSQLGISFMVPVFLCIFIGSWIDKKFATSTILVFVIVGILAGMRNSYILIMGILKSNEDDKRNGR